MKARLHLGYAAFALTYMIGIFLLSHISPEGGSALIDSVSPLLSNALHIPIFAGLAWCLLMAMAGGRWQQTVSWEWYWTVGLIAAAYAALDEWHQSFVPGRSANAGDFLLDCLGIAGCILIHRAWPKQQPLGP